MGRRDRARLHAGLVGERGLVGSPYLDDPGLRQAYDQDLAPRTRAALARIFAGLALPGCKRVLDLGAGTGAAGEAARATFGADLELVSVDRVGGRGVIAADLTRGRPPGLVGRFDLILAAHLLNELPLTVPARAQLVTGWCDDLLAEGGHCIIVEPALRETGRDLLALRDLLVARGFFVVAPCFWQGPCPALARDRDWCHDAAPSVAAGRSRVDFTYLVLRRAGQPSTDPSLFRVVSDPLVEKGRLRLFGCGPAGRHPLVRLDRARTETNAAFDRATRGSVIRVEGAREAGDGLRIEGATPVRG